MALPFLRLFALIAVIVMPLGMAGGAAAATTPGNSAPVSAAAHCGEHPEPADNPSSPSTHCAACAALPALQAPAAIAELLPRGPESIAFVRTFAGFEPEIATPPPKLS